MVSLVSSNQRLRALYNDFIMYSQSSEERRDAQAREQSVRRLLEIVTTFKDTRDFSRFKDECHQHSQVILHHDMPTILMYLQRIRNSSLMATHDNAVDALEHCCIAMLEQVEAAG